jgi:nicotinate-nucleotide adenylyltransferase
MTQRVGIFGGTFDPIHIGHLAAVDDAAALLDLDRVLFVPNRIPPHKMDRSVSSTEARVAMVSLAVAGNPLFELSTIELEREGPSYTLDTLRELRTRFPGAELTFLAGCDALNALHTWHEPEALLREFGMLIMERPTDSPVDWAAIETRFPGIRDQVRVLEVPLLDISSADIRRRVREGRPIRYYVVPAVAEYIQTHGLYRGDAREREDSP